MTISILQIGADDWTASITSCLEWHHTTILDLPTFLARQRDPYVLEQDYVVLTDDVLESTLLSSQIEEWPALRVIYFANQISKDFQDILTERRGFRIEEHTPALVEKRIIDDLSSGQHGFSKSFTEDQFLPQVPKDIHFKREGRFSTKFEGDFGETWQQLGTIIAGKDDFQNNSANEVWLAYDHTEEAAAALLFVFYQLGEIVQQQMIYGEDLHQLKVVVPPEMYDGYEILVFGKGKGLLDFQSIHQRRHRHGLGHLLPGGVWQKTNENEEILNYFNPGNRQKPLIVSFADTRLYVDGFEMREALNTLESPYLLFTDSRVQGGAFDIGTVEYEKSVVQIIKQKIKILGFSPEDVILMGSSMGSYPALYYAEDINPGAVVLAKPILNLGAFTAGSKISRSFDQGWRLDVRRYLTGRVHPDDNEKLNQKLWQHIENTNWTNIQVALFSVTNDEYDGQSLQQLLDFFVEHNTPLTHVTEEGTHMDKLDEMVDFLTTNLEKMKQTMRMEGE
ncbi:accessory Sec system protein Asp2 [Leuconostoc litchii]|uniref:Accessory Sec system protein Asp2 n=1 Tax=Leuconostoc litchii TaxID=1981069 RepID=A0A652NE37_9LACO|nr:accessory Sec system protein Asp2 [Leuconostoc litchii]TYC46150.1 accessory Sec system protein Asp2 [Leuconostoc litchii]GMA69908.1 accessory Sec system protein Asp2 [Leuconostoc litchii]